MKHKGKVIGYLVRRASTGLLYGDGDFFVKGENGAKALKRAQSLADSHGREYQIVSVRIERVVKPRAKTAQLRIVHAAKEGERS